MKKERSVAIDFLKGICILFIILAHSLPQTVQRYSLFIIWGGMAVPLFLLLQSYHVFNKGLGSNVKNTPDLKKVWKRIIQPFLIVLIFSGCLMIILGHDPLQVIKSAIIGGGIGPGSYYVWIYLQFMILLPICLTLFNKIGGGVY